MKTDKILIEILSNHFAGIADEMAYTIHRAAYTVFVKETWDLCAGLVTLDGAIFGYPANIGATNTLGIDLSAAIKRVADWQPGDIVITNDPHSTEGMCTHLPDYMLMKPIFIDDRLLCFAWCFIHASDVGGLVPGSIAPSAYDRLQEGFVLPPTRLVRAGVMNDELVDVIRANSRIPDHNWGDIRAMLSAIGLAERRLLQVTRRHGFDVVAQAINDILDYGERRARQIFSEIPDGEYEFTDYLEADFVTPYLVRIKVRVEVEGDSVLLDFSGTDAPVRAALNLPTYGKPNQWIVHGIYRYLRTTDRRLALNRGILRPVKVHIPAGTILNPGPLAATGVRHAVAYRVSDAVLGALSRAMPARIAAANSGHLAVVLHSHLDAQTGGYKVTVLQPLQGGSGGRPTKDGIDGVNFSNSLRNVPSESIEVDAPILVNRYMLTPPCAPGRHRGGAGVVFEFQSFAPNSIVTARGMDRYRLRPYGRDGGAPGSLGRTVVNPGTDREREIGKIDILKLEPGDVVRIVAPGGGGFGCPLDRDLALIAKDLADGLVTAGEATEHYGVVFAQGAIDPAATAARRAALQAERTHAPYMFGPERARYEAQFPPALQDLIAELLAGTPLASRSYLRERLYAAVADDPDLAAAEIPAARERLVGLIQHAGRLRRPLGVGN